MPIIYRNGHNHCDPCSLANRLIWCGGSIPSVNIMNGDTYQQVVEKIIQYVNDIQGRYIPLAGTNMGEPVTGHIEVIPNVTIRTLDDEGNSYVRFRPQGVGIISLDLNDSSNSVLGVGYDELYMVYNDEIGNDNSIYINTLILTDNINNKGLVGNDYYGANYDDNTYVQKKYVDDLIVSGFIPLTGTTVSNPVIGDIKIEDGLYWTLENDLISLIFNDDGSGFQINTNFGGVSESYFFNDALSASQYIFPNNDENYIQKKYVVDNFLSTSNTLTSSNWQTVHSRIDLKTSLNITDDSNIQSTVRSGNYDPYGATLCDYNSGAFYRIETENLTADRTHIFQDKSGTVAHKEDILYGNTTFTFDGVQTVFNISHGASVTPSSMNLTFSDGANLDFIQSQRTLTSSNITITCGLAPNGTITVYWQVFI